MTISAEGAERPSCIAEAVTLYRPAPQEEAA
jgi:hypothetical protein